MTFVTTTADALQEAGVGIILFFYLFLLHSVFLLCPLSDKGQSLASQVTTRSSQKFLTEICPLGRGHQVPSGEGDSSERACWSFCPFPNCNSFHLQLPKVPQSGKFSPQSPPKFPEDLLPVTKRDSPGVADLYPRILYQRECL